MPHVLALSFSYQYLLIVKAFSILPPDIFLLSVIQISFSTVFQEIRCMKMIFLQFGWWLCLLWIDLLAIFWSMSQWFFSTKLSDSPMCRPQFVVFYLTIWSCSERLVLSSINLNIFLRNCLVDKHQKTVAVCKKKACHNFLKFNLLSKSFLFLLTLLSAETWK